MTDESAPRLRRSERPPLTALQTYGPLGLVLAAMAAVVIVIASTTAPTSVATRAGDTADRGAESLADISKLPPGVETFARAKKEGRADRIDWGDRCDTAIGKVKMPMWPQPDCFQPFTGDNGGATATGVSADTIKVVIYLPRPDDPVLKFIYAQIGDSDTPDDTFTTFSGFATIFNRYYEMYGRKVELVRYDATGPINDPTAATSDAETIARDIKPFAVINGPNLTNAFADTLASNRIICISCTPPQPASWYVERSPYVWDVQRNADQSMEEVAEYLGKRLWNRKAEYAGDPAMHDRKRVFGFIHVISSDSSQEMEDKFTALLSKDYGMSFASIQTYALPTELAGSGKDIITRMKESGVTTIVFSGDPLAPQTLTKIATEQQYRPEWVLGPTTLVDTAVFSRTYDQSQWAHAFGPSGLFVRTLPGTAGPGFLYKWYFGEDAPARSSVPLIAGPLQVLFGGLQGLGPQVSAEGFKEVLFASPISPATPITPQVSFGNRGVFPEPDYSALDDQTEIWWDAEAVGATELGVQGKGMWRYVDGGKRVLLGDWPATEPKLFDKKGSVLAYDKAPPGAELPDYQPLK
ncbi:MAG: ABC transporter substrate-binding protein [Acidimicrobiales bacterium]